MISIILGTEHCHSHEYPAHNGLSYGISSLWATTYSFGTVVYTSGYLLRYVYTLVPLQCASGYVPHDATYGCAHPPVYPRTLSVRPCTL